MEDRQPPVAAVMVARDPGPWFEDALASLRDQNYEDLVVLVVDAGSRQDLRRRVASVYPGAYVSRFNSDRGFSAAANTALSSVRNASYLLFCHDDVVLDPECLSELIAFATSGQVQVTAPKLLQWDDPSRIASVGASADRYGRLWPRAEAGELDQGQHDAVREVLAVESACILVSWEIFEKIGGFDPGICFGGEALDFCWRARLAGSKVAVVPTATARHLGATRRGIRSLAGLIGRESERAREAQAELLAYAEARHRLRTVLCVTPALSWVWLIWGLIGTSLESALVARLRGERLRSRLEWEAWKWVAGHPRELWRRHREVRAKSTMQGEREVRRLLTAPLHPLLEELASLAGLGTPGRRARPARALSGASAVTLGVALLLLVGSRHLLGGGLAQLGEIWANLSPAAMLKAYWSGRRIGVGSTIRTPPVGWVILALLAGICGGSEAAAVRALFFAAMVGGVVGSWRLGSEFGGRGGAVVASIGWALVPLAYDSWAGGNWQVVVAAGAAPWLLSSLARRTREQPLDRPFYRHLRRGSSQQSYWSGLVLLVAGTGLVAGLVPGEIVAMALAGFGLSSALVLAGVERRRGWAAFFAAMAAAGFSLVSDLGELAARPGSLRQVLGLVSGPSPGFSGASIARLALGPIGSGPLSWGLVIAAGFALVVGRDWRRRWAVALWLVYITSGLAAWLAGRFQIGAPPGAFASWAAAALVANLAISWAAFRQDLPAFQLGWRHGALALATAGLVLGALPVIWAAGGGSWRLPANGPGQLLSWVPKDDSGKKLLLVSDYQSLPGVGWPWRDGLSFIVSEGPPSFDELWPGPPSVESARVGAALDSVLEGDTVEAGSLLAGYHIGYLALYCRGGLDALEKRLVEELRQQLDLRELGPGGSRLYAFESEAALARSGGSSGLPVGMALALWAEAGIWAVVCGAVLARWKGARDALTREIL